MANGPFAVGRQGFLTSAVSALGYLVRCEVLSSIPALSPFHSRDIPSQLHSQALPGFSLLETIPCSLGLCPRHCCDVSCVVCRCPEPGSSDRSGRLKTGVGTWEGAHCWLRHLRVLYPMAV